MCIEYLRFPEERVQYDYACSSLAHKPVSRYNIDGSTIKRIWMHACLNKRKAREDDKTGAQCPAANTFNNAPP